MNPNHDAMQAQLVAIVRGSAWFMRALEAVRALHLKSWCIGAGAVRNLVWDHLHGFGQPTALSDVDVAYFDADDLRPDTQARLQDLFDIRVQRNPARVSVETYRLRVAEKRYAERWPRVSVIAC